MKGYKHHYAKAREEFIEWYYNAHPKQEYNTLRSMMLHGDEMIEFDDELRFALEAFDESEQVKIVYEYATVGHLLKIKWEVNPWWPNQVLHFYYCVMLPIDDVDFKTPYQLAGGEEE